MATVNGKPIFEKDIKIPLYADKTGYKPFDPAEAFFSVVGKEILLQVADAKTIVVQPQEVEMEIEAIFKERGTSPDEFANDVIAKFGSKEKYFQLVGQRIGIRKLLEEHVISDVQDPKERTAKTLEWISALFKDADVQIVDASFREKIHAAGGNDWKTFWPRMISASTELKSILFQ